MPVAGSSHWLCSIDPKYPPWKSTDAITVELWKPVSIIRSDPIRSDPIRSDLNLLPICI